MGGAILPGGLPSFPKAVEFDWEPTAYAVRFPRSAVLHKAPYKYGFTVQPMGDVAYVSLLANTTIPPAEYREFLRECSERGFRKVVYDKPGGRRCEIEL